MTSRCARGNWSTSLCYIASRFACWTGSSFSLRSKQLVDRSFVHSLSHRSRLLVRQALLPSFSLRSRQLVATTHFLANLLNWVFFSASRFARGDLLIWVFFLASRFARGNLLNWVFFLASRFARGNWLIGLTSWPLASLEAICGPLHFFYFDPKWPRITLVRGLVASDELKNHFFLNHGTKSFILVFNLSRFEMAQNTAN